MEEVLARNFDLTRERVLRWVTLVFLVPQALLGYAGLTAQYKPSALVEIILCGPLVAQIIFMLAYGRLDRRWRTVGMVLDLIAMVLASVFVVYMAHYVLNQHHNG